MQTCRACGKTTADDAKFCPTCGTYFPTAPTAPEPGATGGVPPAPPPAHAQTWGVPTGAGVRARPLGITILALLYLVLGGLAFLFG
ncbi:MAG: hypothetical protein LC624_12540, partial [Halobacteriales archaeon]|nr:hypothetical protein [Halobacteriales archaeon]